MTPTSTPTPIMTPTATPTATPLATINVAFAGTIDPTTTWAITLPSCPTSYPIYVSAQLDLSDNSGDPPYAGIDDTDGFLNVNVTVDCNNGTFSDTQALQKGDVFELGLPIGCATVTDFVISTDGPTLTGKVTNNMTGVLNYTITSVCGA